MTGRRPHMGDPDDLKGGVFHLLAEVGALLGLLVVMAFLAWVMLLL
ncbi:MAG: hypothetical protein ACLFWM_05120 [Actinomycetota bacterium]